MNSPSDLLILAGKKKKSEHQCSWREEDFKGMVGEASRILRPDTPPSHVRGSQSHSTYGETDVWRPAPSRWELLSRFSRVRLCATPWTAAHQAPVPGLLRARTLGWVWWALGAAKERNFDPFTVRALHTTLGENKVSEAHFKTQTDIYGKCATRPAVFLADSCGSFLSFQLRLPPATENLGFALKCCSLPPACGTVFLRGGTVGLVNEALGGEVHGCQCLPHPGCLLITTRHQSFREFITICSISLFSTVWPLCSKTRYFL